MGDVSDVEMENKDDGNLAHVPSNEEVRDDDERCSADKRTIRDVSVSIITIQ
jgi:hypothetical protein